MPIGRNRENCELGRVWTSLEQCGGRQKAGRRVFASLSQTTTSGGQLHPEPAGLQLAPVKPSNRDAIAGPNRPPPRPSRRNRPEDSWEARAVE